MDKFTYEDGYRDGYRDGERRAWRKAEEHFEKRTAALQAQYDYLLKRIAEADLLNTQPRVIVLEPK